MTLNWTEEQVLAHNTGVQAQAKQSRARGIAPKEDRTFMGRVYHSKSEMLQAQKLELWKKAGRVAAWEPQVAFPITVNGKRICRVVVDFGVTYTDGSYEVLEVKGHVTDLYRIKAKLLLACYPAMKYTVLTV